MVIDDREKLKYIVKWHIDCILNDVPSNFHTLLVGPSGSGKTYTIKEALAEFADVTIPLEHRVKNESTGEYEIITKDHKFPFIEIDASLLSAEGWNGVNLTRALKNAVEDVRLLKYALVYVDEIDKRAVTGCHNHDGPNKALQYNFLKWLDNNNEMFIDNYIKVKTDNITFIFSGAFSGVFEKKCHEATGLGFNASVDKPTLYSHKISWDDIKQYGMMEEFVNRFNILLQTSPYTEEQLEEIAICSDDAFIIEEYFKLEVDTDKAVKEALSQKVGARGIAKSLYQTALEDAYLRDLDSKQQEQGAFEKRLEELHQQLGA